MKASTSTTNSTYGNDRKVMVAAIRKQFRETHADMRLAPVVCNSAFSDVAIGTRYIAHPYVNWSESSQNWTLYEIVTRPNGTVTYVTVVNLGSTREIVNTIYRHYIPVVGSTPVHNHLCDFSFTVLNKLVQDKMISTTKLFQMNRQRGLRQETESMRIALKITNCIASKRTGKR